MIDASCVIDLDALNLLPQLAFLFERLLIPKAVRGELYRRRLTKDRIRGLLRQYAFVWPCDDYDLGVVDAEGARPGKKDRGEAETVVQAATVGAIAVLDDRWAENLPSDTRLSTTARSGS